MISEYYDERGYNIERGIPTEETLRRLGLESVAEDLKRTGVF